MLRIIQYFCLGGVGLACLVSVAKAQNTPWPAPNTPQNVGIGTATPLAKLHVTDEGNVSGGSVLFDADTGITPAQGAGKRLMWIPSKSAFRAGEVSDTLTIQGTVIPFGSGSDFWDDTYIGEYSMAIGYNVKASGYMSHSIGNVSQAEGDASVAIGYDVTTNGAHSYALGTSSEVHGTLGMSVGHHNQVYGEKSMAIGYSSTVHGKNSVSLGTYALSLGDFCVAVGPVKAQSFRSIALGSMNLGLGDSSTSWNPSDPILEVGIGYNTVPKNAMTIYKDGRIQLNELPGTGNAVSIDAQGFLTRTSSFNGFWQQTGSQDIYYHTGKVNIGNPALNPGADLWIDGNIAAHYATFVNPDPGDWFNDETQKVQIGNVLNASVIQWKGTDLTGSSFYGNNGNALLFRFTDANTSIERNVMMLKHDGSVGIGTNNPIQKLHVEGNTLIHGDQTTHGTLTVKSTPGSFFGGDYGQLLIESTSSDEPQVLRMSNGNASSLLSCLNGNLSVLSGHFTIANGGYNTQILSDKVIIGGENTAHPNAKLYVEGKVVCQRAIVTLDDWADFVFDEEYPLRSVHEVKQFIEENGHLPDMPSEKDVLAAGLDVGEINTKLLQKIEELTLYMIDMHEDIQQLKTQTR